VARAKKLVVIDGKSVFYRGYYAMPNLATKDGKSTGGVYGFAVMALEVLKRYKPDYIAVAWDKPKTNIRRRVAIYPEYKANRKPAPPDFYEQVPILFDLLKAFNWPLFEIDDHEADDIMATLAKQAHASNVDTLLITSDHDVLQLINSHTKVATLKKGLTNVQMFDEQTFKEVYDLTPQQFIDYKSLRGDSSDNIPGVKGVGEKTATQLIKDYRSLDGVYQNLDKIKGSLKTKLADDKASAFLARELIILDEDVPVKLSLEEADVTKTNTAQIAKLLRELEFRALLKQLPEGMQATEEEMEEISSSDINFDIKAKVIFNPKDIEKLKLQPKNGLVIQTRTIGSNFRDLSHITLSDKPGQVYIVDFSGQLEPADAMRALQPVLEKTAVIGHNVKNDIKALMHVSLEAGSVKHDTQVGAFLVNPLNRQLSLTELAQNTLGYEGPDLDEVPPMDVQQVAPKAASAIWGLYESQRENIAAVPKLEDLASSIEFPVIPVLAQMEYKGIHLDTAKLKKMSKELEDHISDIEQSIYGHANKEFNIASPGQLADVLFNDLKLPTIGIKKGKTAYSTAANELDKLRDKHPIINLISDYREHTKLKSTYVDTLPKLVDDNGRLHTDFSLVVAATGRLSSSNPNLQNIPVRTELGRKIREAFVADKGKVFISADYSQIELRIAAVLAGDDDLIGAFNDGLDIHTRTASQVHGVAMDDVTKSQRRDAKVINFGVLYGMSPHGLSQATGMTRDEAQDFIDKYFKLRQPLVDYIAKIRKQAEEEGYVETMFGRRRPTPDVKSSNFVVREAAYRQAVNMPIQGTAADLMKMAMIELDKKISHEGDMLLQIHDSVLVEVQEWKAKKLAKEIKEIMENVYKLPVSLDVDVEISQNWGDL
jgi:DNA polymerase-1